MATGDMYLLSRSEKFHLNSGQEASINLRLVRAQSFPCTKIYGQVISNCLQISNATVTVLDMDFRPICHTQTDHKGAFSFINFFAPGNYEIVASAEDYLISRSRFISLKPFLPVYLTIKLIRDKNAEKAAIYGIARSGENISLAKTLVRILSYENTDFKTNITITNADGEYLFTGLKPGKYIISAVCEDYILPEDITVKVLSREKFCVDLYLYRNAIVNKGTVTGVVLQDGYPLPCAMTALYRKESSGYRLIRIQQANENGVYHFTNLQAGEYAVRGEEYYEYVILL